MPVLLFMDHHVPSAVTEGLRERGVDVVTAYEDGSHRLQDPVLLDRATSAGRALFTQDDDLLADAARRQRAGVAFSGVIFARQRHVSIGRCVVDLELIAKVYEPEDLRNQVVYLPL